MSRTGGTIARALAAARTSKGSSIVGLALVAATTACGSEPEPVTAEDYLRSLEEVCTATSAELQALPSPPEQISVADFASSAASALEDEATQAARLEPPDDLDDDHRAFLRNTDEQAAAWRAVAEGGSDEDFVARTNEIGQLVLGRNDLTDEMGAPACRRGAS
jgi:hypothetical protein